MLQVASLFTLFVTIQCHRNRIQNEADLQTALMPQELNPEFFPNKDEPWQAVLPLPRARRNIDELQPLTLIHHIKGYTRIVACAVLAISAFVEIVLYIVEYAYGT